MAPFTAGEDGLWDFLDDEVGIAFWLVSEGGAHDEYRALLAHLIAELLELVVAQGLRRHIDEIELRRVAMLPIDRIARGIDEAFQFAHHFRDYGSIIVLVNNPVTPFVFFQQGRRQPEVTKSPSPFPANSLCDPTCISAINDLLQAWNDMRMAMLAQLDHDPASAHLMGHRTRGARACG
jgi:hypothetical protein